MAKEILIFFIMFSGITIFGQTKDKGEYIYKRNCALCHSFDMKLIGSPLTDILSRREKDWIFKYISDDREFMKTDSIAKRLSQKGNTTVTYHNFKDNISKKDFKKLISFLKTKQVTK